MIHDLTIPEVPPHLTVDNVSRCRFGAEPGNPAALDVIVYGDTHVQRMDLIGSTLCVNPGSPTYPAISRRSSARSADPRAARSPLRLPSAG